MSAAETVTPRELAVAIGGSAQDYARSPVVRAIRVVARELYPDEAPGKGGEWHLRPEQANAIRRRLTGSAAAD